MRRSIGPGSRRSAPTILSSSPNREIFRALRASDQPPTLEHVRAALEPTLHSWLDRLHAEPQPRPAAGPTETVEQDAPQTGLRLRERRLRREAP